VHLLDRMLEDGESHPPPRQKRKMNDIGEGLLSSSVAHVSRFAHISRFRLPDQFSCSSISLVFPELSTIGGTTKHYVLRLYHRASCSCGCSRGPQGIEIVEDRYEGAVELHSAFKKTVFAEEEFEALMHPQVVDKQVHLFKVTQERTRKSMTHV